jgi:hypothetical protein
MKKRTKSKLNLGLIEVLILISIIIHIVAIFELLPGELEWFKWILSSLILTNLFIEAKPTNILFGHENKTFDYVIVISYLIYLIKDIVGGATAIIQDQSMHFMSVHIKNFMMWISYNANSLNMTSLYLASTIIIFISGLMAIKFEIKKPSLLAAIHEDIKISKEPLTILKRFFVIFIVIEFFYIFVFNLIIQWLAMAIDDPLIFIFIFSLFFFLFRQKHIFRESVAKRIIDKAEGIEHFCNKLIKMFHYRKTLPLAISGILVFHTLTDILVYVIPHIFFFVKNSFYKQLHIETHFDFVAKSLIENFIYFSNILSILLILLIPLIIWFSFFYHKKLLFNKYLNGLIVFFYSIFFICPYFKFESIKRSVLVGVNIILQSDIKHIIDPKIAIIFALVFGLIIFIISFNAKLDRIISGSLAIVSILFFGYYLALWTYSVVIYYYQNIIATFTHSYTFASLNLTIFLVITVIFYVVGYVFIFGETVAEIVHQKWSDPFDKEIRYIKHVFHKK